MKEPKKIEEKRIWKKININVERFKKNNFRADNFFSLKEDGYLENGPLSQ